MWGHVEDDWERRLGWVMLEMMLGIVRKGGMKLELEWCC
jgi:hypothetical protein